MNTPFTSTVLITGASSGIGAATARLLVKKGLRILLTARRTDRLNKLREELTQIGGDVVVVPADLSKEEQRLSLFEKTMQIFGRIDVLINNAGMGWYGYFADMPWQTASEMINLNAIAGMHLAHLCLPEMCRQGRGHIINIGSIAGGFPNQGVAVYSATKSLLDAFTSCLYRETRGEPVHVSILRAGPVLTEFCETASRKLGGRHLPTEKMGVSAEKIAQSIWKLICKPRKVVYVPNFLRITPWLEFSFGWLIDRLGPMLLKHKNA